MTNSYLRLAIVAGALLCSGPVEAAGQGPHVAPAGQGGMNLFLRGPGRPGVAGTLLVRYKTLRSRACPDGWTTSAIAFQGNQAGARPSMPANDARACGLDPRLDMEILVATRTGSGEPLQYNSAPLAAALPVNSRLVLDVHLRSAGKSSLLVRAEDVGPDGRTSLVRAVRAQLNADNSRPPDASGVYGIDLGRTSAVIAAGHRLRLTVALAGVDDGPMELFHSPRSPSALRIIPDDQ